MKKLNEVCFWCAMLCACVGACGAATPEIFPPSSDCPKISYAFGVSFGSGWRKRHLELDTGAFGRGLRAGMVADWRLMTEGQAQAALARFDRAHAAAGNTAEATSATPATGFKTASEEMGYALGLTIGISWREAGITMDADQTLVGLKNALGDGFTSQMESASLDTLAKFGRDMRVVQDRRRAELAEQNRRKGAVFLAENGTRPGVVTLPSGLQYQVVKRGDGPSPELTNWVKVDYRGERLDGTEFTRSSVHPEANIFGMRSIISGWAEALQSMNVGAKWRVFVPPGLAYGATGSPEAGPEETLVYELELVSILERQPAPTAEDIRNEKASGDD